MSADIVSPFVPLSKNACEAEPPIVDRFAVTARPVLVGFAPGVTVTVNNVESPTLPVSGVAAPIPVGFVGGVTPHGLAGELVFRGVTGAAVKSEPLLSVSVHPLPFLWSEVVVPIVGAGPLPSKKLAPLAPVP